MASETGFEWWKEAVAFVTAAIASCLAAVKWAVPIGRSMWEAHATASDISREFGRDAGAKLRSILGNLSNKSDIGELKHRIIENQFSIGIYLCDALGKWQYTNKVLAEMYGMQSEDMKGYGWLRPICDANRVHHDWKMSVSNGLPYRTNYVIEPDGKPAVEVYTEAYPIHEDGVVVQYLGVVKTTQEIIQNERQPGSL